MKQELTCSALATAVGFAVLIAAWPARAVQKYIATPIGPANAASAIGISANGQLTGGFLFSQSPPHAYLYSKGTITDLGTLPGGSESYGTGVNDNGQVTGYSGLTNVAPPYHAFLWSSGTMLDLGTLGGPTSLGFGINNSGQVVGSADTASNTTRAFLYSGGSMQDLGTFGGTFSTANGINASGQVTGFARTSGDAATHAFLYTGGAMQDLGTPPGAINSYGMGISNNGQVTGSADLVGFGGPKTVFVYSGGAMHDVGRLSGWRACQGQSINNKGQIVGFCENPGDEGSGTFLYSEGVFYGLDSLVVSGLAPGYRMTSADAINDSGQIAAGACFSQIGPCQAYRLDPIVAPGLVYKPLAPCRIMDTRNATSASGVVGPIIGNGVYPYRIPGFLPATLTNWGSFGGNATSDCGLNSTVGANIWAVAIVITILNPNFDAYLGVGDDDDLTTILQTVALKYTHGQGGSTLYMVPQTFTNSIFFAMPSGVRAQLIFDVVGYMATSDATPLQCTTRTSAPSLIPGGSNSIGNATSPACTAGYTLTAGSCDSTSASMRLAQDMATGGNTAWFCTAINRGATSGNLTATATCCRIPGR
jgi:probable HAF family extracellular repeat protein